MIRLKTLTLGAAVMLLSFAGFSCSRYDTNPADVPSPENDEALAQPSDPAQGAEAGQAQGTNPADTANQPDPQATPTTKQIVLGGGCFWCVEAVYEQLEGVLDVESGYAGGDAFTANYDAVSTGQTKHAEVVRLTYDPTKITLGTILKVFFSTAHDPTTRNRQGADVGPQYRSSIFYANDQQKQIASDYIKLLNDKGVYRNPVVTTVEPLTKFYPAETYHQDYAQQNPNQPYIQGVSKPKVDKTKKAYPDLLRGKHDEQ